MPAAGGSRATGGVSLPPAGGAGSAGGPSDVDFGGPSMLADSGLPDASPEGDGGTTGGASPEPGALEPPGCEGLALQLDGATHVALPRAIENDFTLEAWIRTSASLQGTSGFNGRAIFDADVIGMGNPNDFAVSVLNDRIAFAIGGPDTTVQGVEVVTDDAWVHMAVTRTAANGQLQIVLDGVLQAVATVSNRASLDGRADLALGGFTSTRKFIGAIDEVRLWNVARSVEQIAANMRARSDGSEPGLVGYYRFEDRGVARTVDSSARAVTATVTGNPQYVPSVVLCTPLAPL
jgi:concanavalin A-like lectin/glucanase superfamily protein